MREYRWKDKSHRRASVTSEFNFAVKLGESPSFGPLLRVMNDLSWKSSNALEQNPKGLKPGLDCPASVKLTSLNHVQSSWFYPPWIQTGSGLLLECHVFKMCQEKRDKRRYLPVVMTGFTFILQITLWMLWSPDIQDVFIAVIEEFSAVCDTWQLRRTVWRYIYIFFLFYRINLRSPSLNTKTKLLPRLLPAGSGPRTIAVTVCGLLCQCFCQCSR